MEQLKIGKFIAECRKRENLTQMQLAEKLNITDRAVSKWETGKAMPDSSIMLDLCEILKITVNDLLSGEKITMDNYNKEMENKLIEMVKQKEQSDKRLLHAEIIIVICCLLPLIASIIIVQIVPLEEWLSAVIVLSSLIPLLIATPFAIKIEQKAGYYECQKCSHRHIPKYSSVLWAMHINRTRYMKCPKCKQFSWQKKVISEKQDGR
ncbi:MAG: helix-turn-helix transcriptional regulator [Oscillospiraceae bacterium]|nr:helix-turn-helix transcriptional regulator [Oscillospiraceae bacterium]